MYIAPYAGVIYTIVNIIYHQCSSIRSCLGTNCPINDRRTSTRDSPV